MGKRRKVMLFGLDAACPELLEMFMGQGRLPHCRALIERGVFAENCLCPFPTITPPNWTTISTGANLGTHGITDFAVHLPGDPLDKLQIALSSDLCLAENIFQAAERVSRKSVVINYPVTWPPTIEEGYQVDGSGLEVNMRGLALPTVFTSGAGWAPKAFTAFVQPAYLALERAEEWSNLPQSALPPLEGEMRFDNAPVEVFFQAAPVMAPLGDFFMTEQRSYWVLAYDSRGQGYDRLMICREKDTTTQFADLGPGDWSEIFEDTFMTKLGKIKGYFQASLLRLSPDGSDISLLVPGIHPDFILTHPEGLGREILGKFGPPCLMVGPTIGDGPSYRYLTSRQNEWTADVALDILGGEDWDVFYTHAHCVDFVDHECLRLADPITCDDPSVREEHLEYVGFAYESFDKMVGRVLEAADEDTVVAVVSDHGATAQPYEHDLGKSFQAYGGILEDAGFTAYHEPRNAHVRHIDWERTRAVFQRTCYVYVNLKGRDPQGIVEPGAEYEAVRDQAIETLYDYVDPVTGEKPVLMALRKEDARVFGLWGDRIGDVVYAMDSAYGAHEHCYQLPTSKLGMASMRPIFLLAGPGVGEGVRLERTMWIQDVVPTICHLTGIPVPRDAEGAVVLQALA